MTNLTEQILANAFERSAQRSSTNKMVYKTNHLNTFPTVDLEGNSATGYAYFNGVRLTNFRAREQQVRDGRTGNMKYAVSVDMRMVANEVSIGTIVDGQNIPHPLFTEPRYESWWSLFKDTTNPNTGETEAGYPFRLEAQQFVQAENINLLMEMIKFLNDPDVPMSVEKNPPIQPGRKTRDIYRAVPSMTNNMDIKEAGVVVNWFEVSTNEERDIARNFGRGFTNFYAGIEQQRKRLEDLIQFIENIENLDEEEAQRRAKTVASSKADAMRLNINNICGIYSEKSAEAEQGYATGSVQDRGRRMDVGAIGLGGRDFNLYRARVEQIDVNDFSNIVSSAPSTGSTGDDFDRSLAEMLKNESN